MVSDPCGELREGPEPVDLCVEGQATEGSLNQSTREMEISDQSSGSEDGSRTDQSEREERTFVADLHRFMKERGTAIERIPHLGFKQIDLWRIYKAVETQGGYDSVTARRQWKNVYDELGGSPGSTSAATCTRRHYERLVLPFERQLRGEENRPLPLTKPRKQYKKSPDGKSSRPDGKRKRKLLERDSEVDTEEKAGLGHHCEAGARLHSSPWPAPSDGPRPDRRDSHGEGVSVPPAAACAPSRPAQASPPDTCPRKVPLLQAAAEVISPLEKKKRMAQASLSVPLSPGVDDALGRPSVIHCSPSPGAPPAPGRTRNSSEGSPLPVSSPSTSCSRSPSPYSVSSEDCVAVEERSPPAAKDAEKRTAPPELASGRPSASGSAGVCRPLSRYPNARELAGFPGYHYHYPQEFMQVGHAQPAAAVLTAVKGHRAHPAWTSDGKGGVRHSALKIPPPPLPYTSAARIWLPSTSGFTKVLPKSGDQWPPAVTFQPPNKLNPYHSRRLVPEEALAYGKKQVVPLLGHSDKKGKAKLALPKPLPAQQALLHSHVSLPVPYFLPAYERSRGGSEQQLKSHPPLLFPAHLALSQSPMHPSHRVPLSGPYGSVLHSYPYPMPLAGYSIAGLHPYYANARL